ncbi:Cytochrome P450 2B11 [Mycena sanguinolenta]|uniref:Cytochrome P450 2B11 n=1 Tax=Mycena sanguinolenta TaxID=230812 RepID=A0A8H6Z8V6_9AGAR|nr:Cytochrome P450 2B11 [Mycena sanguinolenta]
MGRLPLQPVAIAAIALLGGVYLLRSHTASEGRRPPGPPGLPLLGNVLQVPVKPVFLIGDIRLAKEILEKRSTKFSARPISPYVRYHVDPAQVYWGLGNQDETHFIGRKLTAGLMAGVRAGKTDPLQQFEVLLNITHLLDDGGENWFHHMDRVSASMVLAAAFGLHCPTGQEPDLAEVLACNAELVILSNPSASIMNFLPFLDIIPGSMPWRERAQTFRKREDALYNRLIARAVSGEASGMNTWAAAFAREDKPEGDQRRLMNQFTGTAASLHTFILACLLYPEWIPRAQREIDAIVGEDRLPSFKDRPRLPFVEAIRPFDGALQVNSPPIVNNDDTSFLSAARFGFPRQSTADDAVEYKGKEYFIPKGSIIFAVSWAIEHDQERFENHDLFQPERFIDNTNNLKAGYETIDITVCPGTPFAERALWINIAMMLWTFNISRSEEPDPKTGLPFKYDDSDSTFHGEALHEWAI